MNDIKTFHEMLNVIFSSYDNDKAMCIREADGWTALSTKSFLEKLKHLTLGLSCIGIQKGQTVGIMGRPSPTWITTDLAIMSLGAVTVPFFPEEPAETISHKIKDAALDCIFLLDQEACTEIGSYRGKIKTLISPCVTGPNSTALSDLIALGKKEAEKYPTLFNEIGESCLPEDLSTIYYTSGSTGRPKGVELTHENITSQINAASKRIHLDKTDSALSCLPLAHSFERFIVYYYLARGVPVYFNSDIHYLSRDLREVRPTIVTAVPRILEKLYERFHARIEKAPFLTRSIGLMSINWAFERKPDSGSMGWKGITANALVFSKLRKALGGGLRALIAGGAAMPPDLYRFFVNAGVPVYQGYGLTEASPVLSANAPNAHKIGTVGLPFSGVEIMIDEGEIMARGPNIMRGYHNMPDETKATIDTTGWLHTGDLGYIDKDGFLSVTGRKKELLKTSCGEYVAPTSIEHSLTKSPLIDIAMIVGEGLPFVTCLLFPEEDVITDNRFRKQVRQIVEDTNSSLEHWEQIKEYRIVEEQLSVSNGMLTPTMKIRRHRVAEEYRDIINEMYNGRQAEKAESAGGES